eukprot:2806949-Rhodomonas_salina.3
MSRAQSELSDRSARNAAHIFSLRGQTLPGCVLRSPSSPNRLKDWPSSFLRLVLSHYEGGPIHTPTFLYSIGVCRPGSAKLKVSAKEGEAERTRENEAENERGAEGKMAETFLPWI